VAYYTEIALSTVCGTRCLKKLYVKYEGMEKEILNFLLKTEDEQLKKAK
jgi:hypothetical protein